MRTRPAGSVLILLGLSGALSAPASIALGQEQPNARQNFRIDGVVIDSLGAAIPFAYVFDNKSGTTVIAQRDGRFHLTLSAALPTTLGARHIGYRPAEIAVSSETQPAFVKILMDRLPQVLDPVRVEGSGGYDEYLDRQGYYRRSANGFGSTFITAAEIDRRNPTGISSMMRDVPGVRVLSGSGRAGKNTAVLGRGGLCSLGLVVDGQRIEIDAPSNEQLQPRIQAIIGGRTVSALQNAGPPGAGYLDEIVPPSMVAAMEIYPSAVSVPTELQQHVRACGLIVVWTRYQ